MCYEWLVTLNHEVNHVWLQKWSLSTWMFACTRYSTLVLNFLQISPAAHGSTVSLSSFMVTDFSLSWCCLRFSILFHTRRLGGKRAILYFDNLSGNRGDVAASGSSGCKMLWYSLKALLLPVGLSRYHWAYAFRLIVALSVFTALRTCALYDRNKYLFIAILFLSISPSIVGIVSTNSQPSYFNLDWFDKSRQ